MDGSLQTSATSFHDRVGAFEATFENKHLVFQLHCRGVQTLRQALRRHAPSPESSGSRPAGGSDDRGSNTAWDAHGSEERVEAYLIQTKGAELAEIVTARECDKLVKKSTRQYDRARTRWIKRIFCRRVCRLRFLARCVAFLRQYTDAAFANGRCARDSRFALLQGIAFSSQDRAKGPGAERMPAITEVRQCNEVARALNESSCLPLLYLAMLLVDNVRPLCMRRHTFWHGIRRMFYFLSVAVYVCHSDATLSTRRLDATQQRFDSYFLKLVVLIEHSETGTC